MNIRGCTLVSCEGKRHAASCSYNATRSDSEKAGAKGQKSWLENRLAADQLGDKLSISAEARQVMAQQKISAEAERSEDNLYSGDEAGLDDDDHLHGVHGDEHHDDDDDDHDTDTGKQLKTKELSREEQQAIRDLQVRDRQVRAHEQAHVAASGRIAVSAPQYEFETGPDDRQYAVGGRVNYTMPAARCPEDKLLLAQQLKRMAMAPADPSPKDRATAAKASGKEARARQEMREEEAEALNETSRHKHDQVAAPAYAADEIQFQGIHPDDAAAGLVQALLVKA